MKYMLGPGVQRVSSHHHHDDCGPAASVVSHVLYYMMMFEMNVCVNDRGAVSHNPAAPAVMG